MLSKNSAALSVLAGLISCWMVLCARAQQAPADATQFLQPNVASAAAPAPVFSRWRSPRVSPSFLSVMDSRYLQLCWAVDGYQRSRVPLLGYREGRFIPAGLSDDPGIYFFIPIMSSILHLSLPHCIDLFFGCIIAIGFGLGATGILRPTTTLGGRVFGIVLLSFLLLLTVLVADVYAAQASLAVAVIPWAVHFDRLGKLPRGATVVAFTFGVVAYLMNTVRMHAGTAVLLFAAIVIFGIRERISRKSLFALTASTGFLFAMAMFSLAIRHRDGYLTGHDRTYHAVIAYHPMWHTIYAGLGFLQNDYGMKYDDSVPFTRVNSVDPHAEYLSSEYEKVLKREVLTFTAAHPKFVAGTLMVKLGVLLLVFLTCANVGLIGAARCAKPWTIEIAFAVSLLFTSLPSLLAVPRMSYLLGYIAFAVLYSITSVEHALQKRKDIHVLRHQLSS